jgi:hypothetical protein
MRIVWVQVVGEAQAHFAVVPFDDDFVGRCTVLRSKFLRISSLVDFARIAVTLYESSVT